MRKTRALAFAAFSAVSTIATIGAAAPQELGVNAHQSADVGMDVAKAAKVKWVRLDFNWLQIEPSSGTYDWTLFDSLVASANAHGLQILAVLAYTPAWASSGDTKGDGPNN